MSSFTQDAILKTFGDMLDRMSFERITVSALIRECGVSRNTFYYHFSDIYALLDEWISRFVQECDTPGMDDDWRTRVKTILHACRDNKRRVYHVYNSLSRDRLEQYIFGRADDTVFNYILRQADGRDVPADRLRSFSEIFRCVVYGFFLRFLWNGMTDDIDGAVDRLGAILEEILRKTLFETKA